MREGAEVGRDFRMYLIRPNQRENRILLNFLSLLFAPALDLLHECIASSRLFIRSLSHFPHTRARSCNPSFAQCSDAAMQFNLMHRHKVEFGWMAKAGQGGNRVQ